MLCLQMQAVRQSCRIWGNMLRSWWMKMMPSSWRFIVWMWSWVDTKPASDHCPNRRYDGFWAESHLVIVQYMRNAPGSIFLAYETIWFQLNLLEFYEKICLYLKFPLFALQYFTSFAAFICFILLSTLPVVKFHRHLYKIYHRYISLLSQQNIFWNK